MDRATFLERLPYAIAMAAALTLSRFCADDIFPRHPERTPVRIGMSAAEARTAWGEPDETERTITATGTRDEWKYGKKTRLYFQNGRIIEIRK